MLCLWYVLAVLYEESCSVFVQTSLASRAIDGLSEGPTRPAVIDALLKYLETDTILYPHDAPPPLVRLQKEHWDPLYKWLKEDFGVELQLAQGFGAVKQSDENMEKLKKVVETMDGWELAGKHLHLNR